MRKKVKKTILITRAAHQSKETAKQYRAKGFKVLEFPCIEIKPPNSWKKIDAAIQKMHAYDWIVFTSANAVEAFCKRCRRGSSPYPPTMGGQPRGAAPTIKIAAIGPATKKACLKYKLNVSLTAKENHSEGLLKAFKKIDLKGKRVLWPRATKVRDVLAKGLRKQGAFVNEAIVYQSVCPKNRQKALLALLKKEKVDKIAFFSSLTVDNFMKILGKSNISLLEGISVEMRFDRLTDRALSLSKGNSYFQSQYK